MLEELDNIVFARTPDSTDVINAEFYGRFRFPWAPVSLDQHCDADLWASMVRQDLGYWGTDCRQLARGDIWVAGCGTNQAVIIALRFPQARVVGSDLSEGSLAVAAGTAAQLGLTNLELRNESLNRVDYAEQFDYIICTGVVHHNAEPGLTLKVLARALKPAGVLELMVYNRYHRLQTTAFQHALQELIGTSRVLRFDSMVPLVRKIARGFALPGNGMPVADVVGGQFDFNDTDAVCSPSSPRLARRVKNQMTELLRICMDVEEVAVADALLQPVERSYTVRSLAGLCATAGLSIAAPCVNQFDAAEGRTSWNLEFEDQEIQQIYDNLPDVSRWHVTNLLGGEQSPRLWFYLRRSDCPERIKTEAEICSDFLASAVRRTKSMKRVYVRDRSGTYRRLPTDTPVVIMPKHPELAAVYAQIEDGQSVADVMSRLRLERTFHVVNRHRTLLATSSFPYLQLFR